MKELLLIVLLLLSTISCYEMPLSADKIMAVNKRVDFMVAFTYLLSHEGYYANVVNDYGGETYCGISRKFNKDWKGWQWIDKQKKRDGRGNLIPLSQNEKGCDMAEHYTIDYYLDLWVKEGFYLLNDQGTANYVLDFRCNGTMGVKITQRALRDLGQNIDLTNVMDESVIRAINRVNKKIFLRRLLDRRVAFYKAIVRRDSSQSKFLHHWLYRANKI